MPAARGDKGMWFTENQFERTVTILDRQTELSITVCRGLGDPWKPVRGAITKLLALREDTGRVTCNEASTTATEILNSRGESKLAAMTEALGA